MISKNKTHFFLFLSLILGSFSDEAAQLIFALNISDSEQIYLTSFLLMLGMVGGILANTLFSKISYYLGIRKVIFLSLIFESLLILFCAFIQSKIFYLPISLLLGILGGLLWSAILIMLPTLTKNEEELNQINKYAHMIRNMGFMLGPVIAGVISTVSSYQNALLIIGFATLLSVLMMIKVPFVSLYEEKVKKKAINGFTSIKYLFMDKKIRLVLSPLVFTIIFTSALSVLNIVYLIDILKLQADKYGLFSATVSISLALMPLILVKPISKFGEATAACFSAAFIGLGLLMLSLTENYILLLLWGAVMGGFNGTQNTIMSAFMLKQIPAADRENYMPAYVLVLQLCVFIGYLISMVITQEYVSITFWLLGLMTILCGVIGAVLNIMIKRYQA